MLDMPVRSRHWQSLHGARCCYTTVGYQREKMLGLLLCLGHSEGTCIVLVKWNKGLFEGAVFDVMIHNMALSLELMNFSV